MEGKIDICLTNFGNEWVTLNKNSQVVNVCSQVDEDKIFEFEGDEDILSTYTERGPLTDDGLSNVPDWEKLINIDNPAATYVMKEKMMEVLRGNSGVMPTKERPLGRCNSVKHGINTGDVVSIKVRPIPYNPE